MACDETSLRELSDCDLLLQTEALTQRERALTINILHHLNEIERRRLHLDLGYRSLFDYCTRKLKYSFSAAGRRIQAARCIRRFPEVLRLLEELELSRSTVALIEPILNEENIASILERVCGASHREVERVVSEFRPPLAFRDRIRPVRVAVSEPLDVDALLVERQCARVAPGVAGHRVRIEHRLLVQFLASEELVEKFEETAALLSGRQPGSSFAEILDVLVTEFLDRHSPVARKQKREERKRAAGPDSRRRECKESGERSRHIPASVRDNVFQRDSGRCAYVARDGTRCASRKNLQIDHIRPVAAGGNNDPSNLRLLCAAHNLRAAEHTLGTRVMAPFWRRE